MNGIFDDLPQGLRLFDLPQPMAGFHHFISSWFFVDSAGRRVVVDPGPASTIPTLLEELSSVTDGVDLILLTHIHLDHSGGVGQLCERYGSAKVVVHGKGRKHLTNPEKLWNASLATLGEITTMYGQPKPLAPEKLLDCESETIPGVEIIETPGHAPHHLSFFTYLDGLRLFFAGEAAGLRMPTSSGKPYLRPTTPPRFDAPAMRETFAKMESAIRGDELLCYAHWGAVRDPMGHIAAAKKQVEEWLDVVAGMEDMTVEEIAEHLISNDPLLAEYSAFPEDLRSRELFFIENSVRGFREYLQNQEQEA